MNINERFLEKGRHITMYNLSLNMADETVIAGASIDSAKKVQIGAEVKPGESTGRLRVFDTGVDSFPDTEGIGFQALTVSASISVGQSMAQLLAKKTAATKPFPQNFKAKRAVTLYADSANSVNVYIGDVNTLANATAADCVGFPLGPGASMTLEITDLSKIYLDCVSSDCVVFWIAV